MTSPISGLSGGTPPTAGTSTPAAGRADMGKDMFLKLLVAQMKYQDPANPATGTEFLAQTAQFTMVEKLSDLSSAQADLLAAQLRLGASNRVGRTVTYVGTDGREAPGTVTSASFSGSSPTLRVGSTDVPLSSVKEVRNTAG
jgi:flagellar basal-body rod modification protein FlgD